MSHEAIDVMDEAGSKAWWPDQKMWHDGKKNGLRVEVMDVDQYLLIQFLGGW
jgi:hypothetical protein